MIFCHFWLSFLRGQNVMRSICSKDPTVWKEGGIRLTPVSRPPLGRKAPGQPLGMPIPCSLISGGRTYCGQSDHCMVPG